MNVCNNNQRKNKAMNLKVSREGFGGNKGKGET